MISYVLSCEITDDELLHLKANGYRLCLLKFTKEGTTTEDGNIVFCDIQSDSLRTNNVFTMEEGYQVAMFDTFQEGEKIELSTEKYKISGGKIAVFDSEGKASITGIADVTKPFFITNKGQEWRRAAIFSRMINLDTKKVESRAFFASREVPLFGTINLKPIIQVGVFFSRDHSTGDMFVTTPTPIFPVSFIDEDSNMVSIKYSRGRWSIS